MAPGDTDHSVRPESRIEPPRCRALDIRAGRQIRAAHPIRFVFTNTVRKHDKLALAFDALVLSKMLGRDLGTGNIVHGNDWATLKVNTGALVSDVRRLIEKVGVLLSSTAPPELILNRHCPECEFKNQCRQKAVEKDDLSLLSGITDSTRSNHRSKGIFTVTQLSYTFRSRRAPKRAKNLAMPHHFALQALAIRKNTVHVHGSPRFPESETQVYLDIEGLPDNESYYLVLPHWCFDCLRRKGDVPLALGRSRITRAGHILPIY